MTAFLQGIGSVIAGTYASARLSMSVPADMDLLNANARWELLDSEGRVWTHGDVTDFVAEPSQVAPGQKTITTEAEVAVPLKLPVNDAGTTYQIRWTLALRNGVSLYSFENFTVMPSTETLEGAIDVLELVGDTARVHIRLPREYKYVNLEGYRGNAKSFVPRSASADGKDGGGYLYTGQVGLRDYINASLDPISIVWSYGDQEDGSDRMRETSQLFIANPVILDAIKDMQAWLNRAYADSGRQPVTTFSPIDFVKYLRTGRDNFNAADKPTEFSMLGAAGPIRWFWIGYSCVAAARAQYLAEGMKAFNFSGQVTQLDIDTTQYWDSAAQAMEQQLSEQVKPFKDNLVKRGILGGDGSSMALRAGAVGAVGITIHGMSPVRGLYGLGSPLTPYQR